MNIGTLVGANKVMVHTKQSSNSPFYGGLSSLAKQLSSGESHTVTNFNGSGKTLHIDVVSISTSSIPSVAKVNIYLGNCVPGVVDADCGTCEKNEDCPAITDDACSQATCVAGQCTTEPAPACFPFELDFLTDEVRFPFTAKSLNTPC